MSRPAQSLIGLRFERFIVIADAAPLIYTPPSGVAVKHRASLCKCECGTEIVVRNSSLKNGSKQSCGCANAPYSNTPTWRSWTMMKARCFTTACTSYPYYGGRGITVCERWLNYEKFVSDMGLRPEGTSIERINGDGHYEPGNCRWATKQEQSENKSSTLRFTINGFTGCLNAVARHFGIKSGNVHNRLRRGWTPERAFLEPIRKSG